MNDRNEGRHASATAGSCTRFAALMCTGLVAAAPVLAQVDALGSPWFWYQLGELHEHDTDFRPFAPQSYMSPQSVAWGADAFQRGGDLDIVVSSRTDIRGEPARVGVQASNLGRTFSTLATAPWGSAGPARGTYAQIWVGQTYIKRSDDAQLRFTYNHSWIELTNYGSSGTGELGAAAVMDVELSEVRNDALFPVPVWRDVQVARFELDRNDVANRRDDRWRVTAYREDFIATPGIAYPAWSWWCTCSNNDGYGTAFAFLDGLGTYTGSVDLSSLDVGDEFQVVLSVFTSAWDFAQGETAAYARLQDPVSTGGGLTLEITGLEATNRFVVPASPVPEPATWALWALGLALLGGMARRRTGDGAQGSRVRQSAPQWMR